MYKKILVAVDGSDISFRALTNAEALAKGMKGELLVLHVTDASPKATQHRTLGITTRLEEKDDSELVYEIKKQLMESPVPFKVKEVSGHAATAIVSAAEEYDCDTIVMGSRGLGNITKLLIGSVSTEVINHAHIPVVIVK